MFKHNFIIFGGHFTISIKNPGSYVIIHVGNVLRYDIIPGLNHCACRFGESRGMNYGSVCQNNIGSTHVSSIADTEAMRTHMRDYELLLVHDNSDTIIWDIPRTYTSRTIIWEIPHIRTLINLPHHAITVKFMLKYLLVRYAFANVCHDVVGIILRSLLECEHAEYVRGREFIKNI